MQVVRRHRRIDFATTASFIYNKSWGYLYLNDRFGDIDCHRGCWGTLVATFDIGTSLRFTDIVLVD